jgi:hypothetical protein
MEINQISIEASFRTRFFCNFLKILFDISACSLKMLSLFTKLRGKQIKEYLTVHSV